MLKHSKDQEYYFTVETKEVMTFEKIHSPLSRTTIGRRKGGGAMVVEAPFSSRLEVEGLWCHGGCGGSRAVGGRGLVQTNWVI